LIDNMVKDANDGCRFSDMVVRIVLSKQFRFQRAD
jgi:hypothetical protein